MDVKDLIARTEQVLREASKAYYADGSSNLSDAEFDSLRDRLEELDPHNPFLTEVGAPSTSNLQKVAHVIPMGSLKKIRAATAEAEFNTWITSQNAKGLQLAVQPKLDGVSVELVYDDGDFVQAITRGDGKVGDDVTHVMNCVQGVPRNISISGKVYVRCECLLPIPAWKKHFGDTANPRNTASGLVGRKDDVNGCEHLMCVAFDIFCEDYEPYSTEELKMEALRDLGFEIAATKVMMPGQVKAFVQKIEDKRDTMPVEIDGVVVKINDVQEQEKRGEHHGIPYWARAWKFAAMGGHTVIKSVEWTVGTQGTINPVAKVEPVDVAGVTITSVTLHNMDEIDRLGVRIGDRVEVIRANDVIPKIVRVVTVGKNQKLITTDKCPACKSKVLRQGPMLVCENGNKCAGAQVVKIQRWISKRNIKHLGPSSVKKLIVGGVVTSVLSLYKMTEDDMVEAGVGKGMASKILKEIEKSRTCSLADLIGSLSIDMLGRSEASNLVGHGVDTLDKWKDLTATQIASFPGYQDTKARRISTGVRENWSLIAKLSAEVAPAPVAKSVSSKLKGQSFCFTGAMSRSRKDLEGMVKANGGAVSSVSKKLTYLVVADPTVSSSKSEKAAKLNVSVISEDDFLKMV